MCRTKIPNLYRPIDSGSWRNAYIIDAVPGHNQNRLVVADTSYGPRHIWVCISYIFRKCRYKRVHLRFRRKTNIWHVIRMFALNGGHPTRYRTNITNPVQVVLSGSMVYVIDRTSSGKYLLRRVRTRVSYVLKMTLSLMKISLLMAKA